MLYPVCMIWSLGIIGHIIWKWQYLFSERDQGEGPHEWVMTWVLSIFWFIPPAASSILWITKRRQEEDRTLSITAQK
jgi:hypothetical protein